MRPRARNAPSVARKAMSLRDRPVHVDELDEPRGGGVQSIGRAFAILEEIARSRDGISLAELSKRVGLHNSTTFHLVKTMVTLGYVRQLKDSKRYRVGRPLFALAASSLDDVEMVSMATPVLEDLSRETGESGHFAVRMGDSVVVHRPHQRVGRLPADRPGRRDPAGACTALGKIVLAALRPEQLERYLAAGRVEAAYAQVDRRDRQSCAGRSRRSAAPASPTTTASSTPSCAAWPCRCAISPAR